MPSSTARMAHSARSMPFSHLPGFLTPQRYRKHERFVATLPDYTDVHRSIAQRQHYYIAEPRRNYVRTLTWWFQMLAPDQALFLHASNMEARIAFARLALARLREHRELYGGPVHFVTISPRTFVLPLETASQVNLHALKRLAGQALAGLSHIGMVDFGLFKCWGERGMRELNDHVSAHTHSLVFGATREAIVAGFNAMGVSFTSVTRLSAGHVMEITPEQVEGYLLYLLKAPLFFYKVERGDGLGNPTLGKHVLRPGDQLRMGAVLSDMYLTDLFFGQHAGTPFVRAVRTAARAPMVAYNHRHPREPVDVCYTVPADDRALLSSLVRSPPAFLSYLRSFGVAGRDPEDDGTPEDRSATLVGQSYYADLDDLVDL